MNKNINSYYKFSLNVNFRDGASIQEAYIDINKNNIQDSNEPTIREKKLPWYKRWKKEDKQLVDNYYTDLYSDYRAALPLDFLDKVAELKTYNKKKSSIKDFIKNYVKEKTGVKPGDIKNGRLYVELDPITDEASGYLDFEALLQDNSTKKESIKHNNPKVL